MSALKCSVPLTHLPRRWRGVRRCQRDIDQQYRILPQFSEQMQQADAQDPLNYSIAAVGAPTQLPVWDAMYANADQSAVLLSTFSPSNVCSYIRASLSSLCFESYCFRLSPVWARCPLLVDSRSLAATFERQLWGTAPKLEVISGDSRPIAVISIPA